MVCDGFIEPLNLECIMVNVLSGTTLIFTFLAFVVIAGLAAKLKMRNGIAVLMFGLFGMFFAQYTNGLYVLTILVGGIISFTLIKRIISTQ